ncbi:MAG: (d)CMP kinase [Verrucomicrobia bacterium]|nr:(d)CMP kinase [Verrucomicrobiota bacterium]
MKTPNVIEIEPLARPPFVPVSVPGSRQITLRALVLAALGKGLHTLHNALFCEDVEAMIDGLRRLGFELRADHARLLIEVEGGDGAIPAAHAELFVGNSATAARYLAALACLGRGRYRIHGLPRLHDQPMEDLFEALSGLGVQFDGRNNKLPVVIHSAGLKPGHVTLNVPVSSPFASAVMLVAARAGLEVAFTGGDDRAGLVAMTRAMIKEWAGGGLRDYVVEPDMGRASCFIGAGFITGGKVSVLGGAEASLQRDAKFPQFLPPPANVSYGADLGDSVLTLAGCALFSQQPLSVRDVAAPSTPEHDPIRLLAGELRKLGAQVEETEDSVTVWPAQPGQLHSAEVQTHNNTHIAMTLAMLGLKLHGLRISNPACVRRAFPDFLERLDWLRRVVIAIDGTSGSGKSTLAKRLAKQFGFNHVDTGAMYRTLTWQCLRHLVDCNDPAAVVGAMHAMKTEFHVFAGRILMFVDGADPGEAIRGEAVNQTVSLVARIPEVRAWMVARQRELIRFGSLVMEGRDIGSVVFAETPFKFYLDAHLDARVERRTRDGYSDQLKQRDLLDTTRRISPLVIASGACVLDTSGNTPEQTAALALEELKRRGL